MKRYFVITHSVDDQTTRLLLEADGPVVRAWSPDQRIWVDGTWAYDSLYGDDRNECIEVTAESVERLQRSSTLNTSAHDREPIDTRSASTAGASLSDLNAEQILEKLQIDLGWFAPQARQTRTTLEELAASMAEQDISYDSRNPGVRLSTAYATGEISDKQYAEIYDLISRRMNSDD